MQCTLYLNTLVVRLSSETLLPCILNATLDMQQTAVGRPRTQAAVVGSAVVPAAQLVAERRHVQAGQHPADLPQTDNL